MKAFNSLEMEKIAHTVRENPCVWDTSCPQYRLTVNSDKVFQKIASDLGKDSEDVMKCWAAMRLKYSREKKREKEEMPRSGASGGVKKKYKTADWELRPYMTFLDKTLGRRSVFEQLDIPHSIPLDESSNTQNEPLSSINDPEEEGQMPSSIGVRSQSVEQQDYLENFSSQTVFGPQSTLPSPNKTPLPSTATSPPASSGTSHSLAEKDEFPTSKKRGRAEAKIYEEERRMFINKISDVLTTAQSSSTRNQAIAPDKPKTVDERMVYSFGEYVTMRLLNWSKEKWIVGFQMLTETIEKIEKI